MNMDFTNLEKFLDYMAAEHTPGNAVEVFLDGKQVFKYASGYSDLESQTAMTGDVTQELRKDFSVSLDGVVQQVLPLS